MPQDFWDMIPSEFAIFVKGKVSTLNKEHERKQRDLAFIATMIANFSGRSKKRYRVEDFLPKKKATGKNMIDEVKRLNALFGGEVRRK